MPKCGDIYVNTKGLGSIIKGYVDCFVLIEPYSTDFEKDGKYWHIIDGVKVDLYEKDHWRAHYGQYNPTEGKIILTNLSMVIFNPNRPDYIFAEVNLSDNFGPKKHFTKEEKEKLLENK
jgi:hypothetical protein